MSRDYAKVMPSFWTGETGRSLRGDPDAMVVAMYLITCPHANMLGLYYLPKLYIAHETGRGIEGASKGLARCIERGFCEYDEASETVWVHEMAAIQIERSLKPGDKRASGVQKQYDSLHNNPFLGKFFDKYASAFHLKNRREGSPLEGACKPLRSQEQEQEQEQYLFPAEAEKAKPAKREKPQKDPTPKPSSQVVAFYRELTGQDFDPRASYKLVNSMIAAGVPLERIKAVVEDAVKRPYRFPDGGHCDTLAGILSEKMFPKLEARLHESGPSEPQLSPQQKLEAFKLANAKRKAEREAAERAFDA